MVDPLPLPGERQTVPEHVQPFDRNLLRRRRSRALRTIDAHRFLFDHAADGLIDRLDDVARSFPNVLDLGCGPGTLTERLRQRAGIEMVLASDLSAGAARRAGPPAFVADEEFLPLEAGQLDLVVSNLVLQFTNDLPGALVQIRRALKPDGFFLACLVGGTSLQALRLCLMEAEERVMGGISPRVAPFVDVRDAGSLLQRAGFALPVVDVEHVKLTYAHILALMADLRGFGATNILHDRVRRFTPRSVFAEAGRLYAERFADSEGRLEAGIDLLYLAGWAPAASQQQPMRPGTAQHRLADALNTRELGPHGLDIEEER